MASCIKRYKSNLRNEVEAANKRNENLDWWEEFCKESAVHGMPYLARKDLHWIERIFWLAMIIGAAYYAGSTCYAQWERYRDNPIVYEYEYLFALRSFSLLGITVCTKFPKVDKAEQLINDTWGLEAGLDLKKSEYYQEFLTTLNHLKYSNLDTLIPYENDTSLQNVNFVKLLLNLQQAIMPNPKQQPVHFVPTLTEIGLCQTTSQLSHFGNPYGIHQELTGPPVRVCSSFANCQTTIKPALPDTQVLLFMHDVNEVMLPQDRRTVLIDAGTESSYALKLLLSPISAEDEVRKVPIAYRKCRYTEENYLQYYSPYHPSLCRLECRIKVALDLCNCKPFFYAAAPNARICSIKDMICLARRKWLEIPCDCLPLCRENSYIVSEELEQNGNVNQYAGTNFERTIIIQLELPKMGMKRRVVFSTDQLLMSLGGAIGLFLGASFMTIYGLIYLAIYFLVVKCKCRRRVQLRVKQRL